MHDGRLRDRGILLNHEVDRIGYSRTQRIMAQKPCMVKTLDRINVAAEPEHLAQPLAESRDIQFVDDQIRMCNGIFGFAFRTACSGPSGPWAADTG